MGACIHECACVCVVCVCVCMCVCVCVCVLCVCVCVCARVYTNLGVADLLMTGCLVDRSERQVQKVP